MLRIEVYAAINAERARQDAKFPGQWRAFAEAFDVDVVERHAGSLGTASRRAAFECAAILTEESGEVARAVIEGDGDGLRAELVQVAAVAVAWLEALPA